MSSHGKRIVEYNKQNQTTFWDPRFQSEQGKKGGSANTPAQQEARSKVGKEYGPLVGVSNQSQPLKEALSHIMVFFHEEGAECSCLQNSCCSF